MITKVLKWGNSLGIRIPKSIAERIQLFKGERVQMEILDDKIVIEALEEDVSLDALLSGITPEKIDRNVWPDKPMGREAL
jgi:antitoxin MazE